MLHSGSLPAWLSARVKEVAAIPTTPIMSRKFSGRKFINISFPFDVDVATAIAAVRRHWFR
jgi:hypothetical protein